MSESGDNKIIGNFRKLIDEVSADPDYNPANDALKIPALETQYTSGDGVVNSVNATRAPYKLSVTDRESAFKSLRALVVRSRNYLKASGASKGVVEDADTFVRKLSGSRKTPKPNTTPATPGSGPAAPGSGGTPPVVDDEGSSSASQMSYDNQVGNFESYIEILKNVPQYNPNEADLKITSLVALAASLTAKSNVVNTTSATLNQARGQRDKLLYTDEDSIVSTATLVKSYVQSALGSSSKLYKKIKGLRFEKSRRTR